MPFQNVYIELEGKWKEAVVACSRVLSQHLPQQTEESHKVSYSLTAFSVIIWNQDLLSTK
jgi:hypothetical protein